MDRRYPALIGFSLMVGCAGAPMPAAEAPPLGSVLPRVPPPVSSPAPPARALGIAGTFGDFVSAVRALDGAGAADSDEPCMFRHLAGGALRVDADLAVAVRPLPEASTNLAGRLRATGGAVQVLGRWGRFGPIDAGLNVVAMTSAAPRAADRRALTLFVTHGAVHIRTTGFGLPFALMEPITNLGEAVLGVIQRLAPDVILVTADASLSLTRVLEVGRAVSDLGIRVGFVVLLPPETRLPPVGPSEEGSDVGLCTAGLPENPGVAEGSRDPRALRQSLISVQALAQACMSSVGGGMTPEGVMEVLLRIGPGGAVANACAIQDGLGVPALRVCILERLRSLDFGPADGVVDVALPLRLVSQGRSPQQLECRDAPSP